MAELTSFEAPDAAEREERRLLESVPLFAALTHDELTLVHSNCLRVRVLAGDWLMEEGDPSDALYIVIHGRLKAFGGGAAGEEMSRGHVLGEIGILTGEPRTAGVRAVRDSELLSLPREECDRLAESNGTWLRRVSQVVVERLVNRDRPGDSESVLTLGIFSLDDPRTAVDIARSLRDTLNDSAPAVLESSGNAPTADKRARWAYGLESSCRYVLYDGTSGAAEWRAWCLRHSDRVLLVGDASRPAAGLPVDLEAELARREGTRTATLLLVHPSSARRPSSVARWLAATGAAQHLHVRRGNKGDLLRVARLLTGRGCGLVLGGGGPRGFAHLGVMKALDECGIPVDAVGGTSIGAVMGALRAMDLDDSTRQELAITALVHSGNLFNPTFPLLSFSSARRVRRLLEDPKYFGDLSIEECWVPYFCVSANLTRAEIVIHDRGMLARAVRASMTLPGVFPPVRQGRDLLVDGGVLNNLPVDIMRDRLNGGSVIGVDLSVPVELAAPPHYQETPSGWRLLAERFLGRDRSALPPAFGVLMRAKDLAGIQAQRAKLDAFEPDLMIHPDVAGYKMFDFKTTQHLVEVGYRHALTQLEQGTWAPLG